VNPDCSRIAASGARQARYTPGELEELLAGTTVRGRIARGLARGAERAGALKAGIEWAWHAGQAPRLTLPRDTDRILIGRAPGSDCVFDRDTVSRRHAMLLHAQGRWTIEDLGSLNGTRLNGWPVLIPTEVRAGDLVSFGEVTCRISS
jgi:hypothetical protein